jgi:mannose/cellobiose epimerase-like protein (N-acyl-D-glucosamine 2-epimerase family)
MPVSTNAPRAQALDEWLLKHVCPFWAKQIVADSGGYLEALDADGVPVHGSHRSVLNQARLTYVFSHAYCTGRDPAMLQAATHGYDFLCWASKLAGANEGWHRMITVDGQVVDIARDAYDHAFVILAMAWYWRASGNAQALVFADQAYAFMEHRLADSTHGGFFEQWPTKGQGPVLPRRQNPHMHLLEATLAMYDATMLTHWLDRGRALVTLFERHFFDAATGSLIEFFGPDWKPVAGASGAWREPGHQFEWVWLLCEFFRHAQAPRVFAFADQLYRFGTAFGIDRSASQPTLVFDGVQSNGELAADTKLFWPQTEYIKACLARFEWRGDASAGIEAITQLERLRTYFFRSDGASWRNQLSRSGVPVQAETPARVLYHLFVAVAETIRLCGNGGIICETLRPAAGG